MRMINIKAIQNAVSFNIVEQGKYFKGKLPNGFPKNQYSYNSDLDVHYKKPYIVVDFGYCERCLFFDTFKQMEDFICKYLPDYTEEIIITECDINTIRR